MKAGDSHRVEAMEKGEREADKNYAYNIIVFAN